MIILKNPGEISLEVIKTMGVNVKESANPFGSFGTGLKYAIAVFLRLNIGITLYVGETKYRFYTEPHIIRGKEFRLCKMQGPYSTVDLPYTTELGKNWEAWQAYREIDCNCMDENGNISSAETAEGEIGYTTFVIDNMDTRGIFLRDMDLPLLFSNEKIDICMGQSGWIYYRGVRAKKLDRLSMHTYNIKQTCHLTEDRLLCYDHQVQHAINDSVAQMGDKQIIKSVITAPPHCYEATLDLKNNSYVAPEPPFLEVYHEDTNAVSSSVRDYVAAHMPKAELTRAQRREQMLAQLEDFCAGHNLQFEVTTDCILIDGELVYEAAA